MLDPGLRISGDTVEDELNVLDPEFDPRGIAASLESQVTGAAKGVLVEHGYVDKDYRSTFYNFYAKKGRHYRSDCVRLHFFNGVVWHDEERTDIACNDGSRAVVIARVAAGGDAPGRRRQPPSL